MSIIDSLEWRAAVKKFDSSKKVSAEDLETILSAGNLTATSMGLQPFRMVVVENEDLKKELLPFSFNQSQVVDGSHILVFAIETNLNDASIDALVQRTMDARGLSSEDLEGYRKSIGGYLSTMSQETKLSWATKQAYIALGTVMATAAELKIDSCPMEGFDPLQYQKLLDLESKNLMPVVILPVGYRSGEEQIANLPKVRKSLDEFVHMVK